MQRRDFIKILAATPLVGLPCVEPAPLKTLGECAMLAKYDPREWSYRITVKFPDDSEMEFASKRQHHSIRADEDLARHCMDLVLTSPEPVSIMCCSPAPRLGLGS